MKLAREKATRGVEGGAKASGQRWLQRRREKRNEIFQMAVLGPALSFLDETDSGLDIDALRIVSEGVGIAKPGPKYDCDHSLPATVGPHRSGSVHVLADGRIIKSGDQSGFDAGGRDQPSSCGGSEAVMERFRGLSGL